jgi:hypothetical protein
MSVLREARKPLWMLWGAAAATAKAVVPSDS